MTSFFADINNFVMTSSKIRLFTKKAITPEPLIVEKWLTPQIKALMKLYSEHVKWMAHLDSFLQTSALFGQEIGR